MVRLKLSLSSLYDSLNMQLFGGRLSKRRVVFASLDWRHGEIVPNRRLIRISRSIASDPEMLRRTLLHEMCHIGCTHHGREFQERLRMLGDQGEKWAYEEAESYRTSPTCNQMTSSLISSMEDITCTLGGTCEASYPSFDRVVERLALDFSISPRDLKRKVPWLRSSWKRVKREVIEARMAEKARSGL